SASFSPDGTKVVSSGVDATVRVWDTESGRELARLLSHSQPVAWAGFVDGGRTVLSADWGGVIKSWSAGGHADFVNAISFSPSGDI
ncbi:WD40 repeat domain-containing protein, partial [Staphylococcus aureus]